MCNFPSAQNIEKKMKESMEKKNPTGEFFALPCVGELCVRQKLLKSPTEGLYSMYMCVYIRVAKVGEKGRPSIKT